MSKGSNSRPLSVPREQFDAAFDSIFKKRTPEERAKDELGPFVVQGDVEGDDMLSIRPGGIIRMRRAEE